MVRTASIFLLNCVMSTLFKWGRCLSCLCGVSRGKCPEAALRGHFVKNIGPISILCVNNCYTNINGHILHTFTLRFH